MSGQEQKLGVRQKGFLFGFASAVRSELPQIPIRTLCLLRHVAPLPIGIGRETPRIPRLHIDIQEKAVRFHRLPQFPHGGI